MQKLIVAALALAAAWLAAKALGRLMRAGLPRVETKEGEGAGRPARRIAQLRQDPKTGIYRPDDDQRA